MMFELLFNILNFLFDFPPVQTVLLFLLGVIAVSSVLRALSIYIKI